uniref:NADH-ubiquinone oxidoreductase chain 4 n=1 Tax=Phloeosinus perlatus TaxID=2800998 RepID=A0A891GTM8_9CUCU|nr:NADH dehydrogenase subunit 4 [Phloeosinus perlatus]QRK25841.1 NADH dehydrogenase subunit 4 [Phloeosinus perlatus]
MGLFFLVPLTFLDFWFFLYGVFFISFCFFIILNLNWFSIDLEYFMGVDCLSFIMICLSFWICCLMVLASELIYSNKNYKDIFLFMMLLLIISLILAFMSLNLFVFYLFFEVSLIPTLILIIGWGNQPERILAGSYLLFYTLFASLPMMVSLFFLNKSLYSLDFYFLSNIGGAFFYLCLNFVFFVKIPLYFVHLWLPKAHVEAPISGSMILAGVMLKLGGYGIFRTMKLFLGVKILNMFIIIISLMGAVYISLICLRQSDMKMLIAYSSVSHMGLALGGILTLNLMGAWGGLMLMVAHGLSSSALFCLANMSYERTFSRSIYLNKGMLNIIPSVSFWWFLLCACNMAAPPSLNLLSEIFLICSLVIFSKWVMIILFFLTFYSAVYSLFLFSYTQHGSAYSGGYSFSSISVREYLLLFLHWFPLNILFLKSESFIWIYLNSLMKILICGISDML